MLQTAGQEPDDIVPDTCGDNHRVSCEGGVTSVPGADSLTTDVGPWLVWVLGTGHITTGHRVPGGDTSTGSM